MERRDVQRCEGACRARVWRGMICKGVEGVHGTMCGGVCRARCVQGCDVWNTLSTHHMPLHTSCPSTHHTLHATPLCTSVIALI